MAINSIRLLIVLILFSSCIGTKQTTFTDTDYSSLSIYELKHKKENLTILLNHEIALKYIEYHKRERKAIPIGKFGFKEVRLYWQTIPELKKYRSQFEDANDKLREFIVSKYYSYEIASNKLKNKEISLKEYNAIKCDVFQKLTKNYPNEYLPLREDRDDKLQQCNIKTLEYILDDYNKKMRLFPVDWIDENELDMIKSTRYIKDISSELIVVEKEIIDRI